MNLWMSYNSCNCVIKDSTKMLTGCLVKTKVAIFVIWEKMDFGAKCEKYGTLPIYSYKTRTNFLRIFLFSQLYLLCVTCTAQFFGVSLCPSRTPLISPLPPFLTFLSFPLKTLPLLDWIGLNKFFWLVASGVRLDQWCNEQVEGQLNHFNIITLYQN